MARLIVRKLGDAAKERLDARAARNGRSAEAEAQAIVEEALEDEPLAGGRADNQSLGEFMSDAFKGIGLTDEEWQLFNVGVSDLNSDLTYPNFDADEYEGSHSDT